LYVHAWYLICDSWQSLHPVNSSYLLAWQSFVIQSFDKTSTKISGHPSSGCGFLILNLKLNFIVLEIKVLHICFNIAEILLFVNIPIQAELFFHFCSASKFAETKFHIYFWQLLLTLWLINTLNGIPMLLSSEVKGVLMQDLLCIWFAFLKSELCKDIFKQIVKKHWKKSKVKVNSCSRVVIFWIRSVRLSCLTIIYMEK